MASGDTMWILYPESSKPTATLYATLDVIADGSTPVSLTPVLDFDGSADEHAEWNERVPSHYAGGGFTAIAKLAMSGTDGSDVELEFRVKTIADGQLLTADIGMDTQTLASIAGTPDPAANEVATITGAALSHANAGSPAVDAQVRIRVSRDFDHGVNTDDLQLLSISVKET